MPGRKNGPVQSVRAGIVMRETSSTGSRPAGSQKSKKDSLAPAENYFPISADTLNPEALTDFQVYLRRNDRFILYTKEREQFSQELKNRLIENGIDTVYVPYHQQASYESYVFNNLEFILNDPAIPVSTRSRVFLDTTSRQVGHFFQQRLPQVDESALENIRHVVASSLEFLSSRDVMNNIGQFVSHDYKTFSHSVQVFTYAIMLMHVLRDDWEQQALIDAGIGAMLHDIGKVHVPRKILNKPGKLNEKEWSYIVGHPVYGMRMCANVDIQRDSLNCIMFHHEKFDGTGYPSGMKGSEVPLPARIMACCDVYDALTSKRPYAEAKTPFEALKIMGEEMKGSFDPDIFRTFIRMLGDRDQG